MSGSTRELWVQGAASLILLCRVRRECPLLYSLAWSLWGHLWVAAFTYISKKFGLQRNILPMLYHFLLILIQIQPWK